MTQIFSQLSDVSNFYLWNFYFFKFFCGSLSHIHLFHIWAFHWKTIFSHFLFFINYIILFYHVTGKFIFISPSALIHPPSYTLYYCTCTIKLITYEFLWIPTRPNMKVLRQKNMWISQLIWIVHVDLNIFLHEFK
jgi:hypothetical protein